MEYRDIGYYWALIAMAISMLTTVGVYVNLYAIQEVSLKKVWESYQFIIGVPAGLFLYGLLYGAVISILGAPDYSVGLLIPIALIPVGYVIYMLITSPVLMDQVMFHSYFPVGVLSSFTTIALITAIVHPYR